MAAPDWLPPPRAGALVGAEPSASPGGLQPDTPPFDNENHYH